MRLVAKLLVSLSIALWIGAIAIFSIQNIQPVSLKFITFESISFPVGVLLAFSAGVGMILGSLLPLLWQRGKRRYY
ncbi:LapA family protein [Myxosarcina sp. GI1(2024)]